MRRISFFIILTVIFTGLPAAAENDQDKKVFSTVTTGEAVVTAENIPGAKKAAVSGALKESVKRALSDMMSSDLFAANLEFIFAYILPDSDRYIANYRVLREFERGRQFIAAVKADVDASALERVLQKYEILDSKEDQPSVLLLISEKNGRDILPRYWWGNNPLPYESVAEKAIQTRIQENGYSIEAGGEEKPDPEMHDIRFDAIYDHEAALKLGEALQADFVVIGKAKSAEASNRMAETRIYQGTLLADVYNVKKKEKIGSSEIDTTVKSESEEEGRETVLAKAGKQAGEAIVSTIDEYWTQNVIKKQQTIEARLEGTDYLSSFILLRKVLNKMPEIRNIQTKELGSDQAVVDIAFNGDAKGLADALLLKTFDSFGIQIFDVKEDSLTIRFVPKDKSQPVKKEEVESAYISE